MGLTSNQLLAASGRGEKDKGCTGSAKLAEPDKKTGLRIVEQNEDQ